MSKFKFIQKLISAFDGLAFEEITEEEKLILDRMANYEHLFSASCRYFQITQDCKRYDAVAYEDACIDLKSALEKTRGERMFLIGSQFSSLTKRRILMFEEFGSHPIYKNAMAKLTRKELDLCYQFFILHDDQNCEKFSVTAHLWMLDDREKPKNHATMWDLVNQANEAVKRRENV